MNPRNVFHALGLHMHQPPGNLELLIESNEWEAETSCFLFWGDSWIPHLYERTRPAEQLLARAEGGG